MSPTSSNNDDDASRGLWVPWIIVAFYVSFIVPLLVFVYIAFSNPPSEVTTKPYEKGLAYNQVIAKAKEQDNLGWKMDARIEDAVLMITLADAENQPIQNAKVEAWFVHPAKHTKDQEMFPQETSPGTYTIDLANITTGLWTLHVSVLAEGKEFQAAKEIMVR